MARPHLFTTGHHIDKYNGPSYWQVGENINQVCRLCMEKISDIACSYGFGVSHIKCKRHLLKEYLQNRMFQYYGNIILHSWPSNYSEIYNSRSTINSRILTPCRMLKTFVDQWPPTCFQKIVSQAVYANTMVVFRPAMCMAHKFIPFY